MAVVRNIIFLGIYELMNDFIRNFYRCDMYEFCYNNVYLKFYVLNSGKIYVYMVCLRKLFIVNLNIICRWDE